MFVFERLDEIGGGEGLIQTSGSADGGEFFADCFFVAFLFG